MGEREANTDTNINNDDSSSADQNINKSEDVQGSEKRYKTDMLRYKSEKAATEAENLKLKDQLEQRTIQDLETNKKHEELAEHYKNENATLKERLTGVTQAVVNDKKFNALEREARLQGMNEKAIKLLKNGAYDTDSIIIETTSENNVNVLGVKEFVDNLKRDEDWLFVDQLAPNINNGANLKTITGDGTINSKDLLALEKTDYKKYEEINAKARKGEIKII